jgi:hypothetical protein
MYVTYSYTVTLCYDVIVAVIKKIDENIQIYESPLSSFW